MMKRWVICAVGALGCDDGEPSTGTEFVAQGGSSAQTTGGQGGTESSDAGAGGSGPGSGGSSAGAGGSVSLGGTTGSAGTSSSGGSGGASGGPTGNEQIECLEPGELDCSAAAVCCEGARCVTDGLQIVCATLCTTGDECQSGCCAAVDETSSVCAPPTFCPPPVEACTVDSECATVCCLPIDDETSACAPANLCAAQPAVGCGDLVLLANDGTYLGDATSNELAVDGVCNEFSQYGSPFASTSIFNEFGEYGSAFASLSAYNEFTSTPPVLYCSGNDTVLNAVSKNTFIAEAIDPDFLCAVLAQNGL